jgi:hypothetical protein
VLELLDGTINNDKQFSYSLESASNPPIRWLVPCWSTFSARTSHGQLWTHNTHLGLDSGEATTLPHIVYFAPLRKGHIQMAFCPRTPLLPRLELLQLCRVITLCTNLRLGQGLKQSYSSCQNLSNGVLHTTCMYGNRVNSRLFVVRSQTANLTCDLFFAITYVADVQMGHESPFQTSPFQ